MSYGDSAMLTQSSVQPGVELERLRPIPGLESNRRLLTAEHSCFVMSLHADRRGQLASAAAEAGWETVVCDDAQEARDVLHHEPCRLALLDIQDATLVQFEDLKRVAELVVSQPGQLLVVCGNPGDPREELWARQVGAWLYLPGVDADCDLSLICQEARTVVERLVARAGTRVS